MSKLVSDLDFSAPSPKMKKGTPVAFEDLLDMDDAPPPFLSPKKASGAKAEKKVVPAKAPNIVSTLEFVTKGARIFPLELVKKSGADGLVAKTKGPIERVGPKMTAFYEGLGVVKKAVETDSGHKIALKFSPTSRLEMRGNAEGGTVVTFHA